MSNPINDTIYQEILNSEGFVNDVWNKFDQTTKVEILQKSGVDLADEYVKANGSAEESQEELWDTRDNKNEDSNFEVAG